MRIQGIEWESRGWNSLLVIRWMADEAQEEYQKSWTEKLPGLNI